MRDDVARVRKQKHALWRELREPAQAVKDHMTQNPRDPYIVTNDLPTVGALKRLFPERFRGQPVLVKPKSAKR